MSVLYLAQDLDLNPHFQVPITYIWSPSLVERPPDWPSYLEVWILIVWNTKAHSSRLPTSRS